MPLKARSSNVRSKRSPAPSPQPPPISRKASPRSVKSANRISVATDSTVALFPTFGREKGSKLRVESVHDPSGVRYRLDRTVALRVDHEVAGEAQGAVLATRTQRVILDPLEVDVVREAENSADHFGGRKAERILKEPIHIGLPRRLEGHSASGSLEERGRIGITRW